MGNEACNHSHGLKGHLTTKPPLFDGVNYDYCKFGMMMFIKFADIEVWKFIKKGPHAPTKKISGKDAFKPKFDYSDNDYKNGSDSLQS